MTKDEYYAMIADRLAPLWERDARMLALDPDTWHLARALDDQLVADRTSNSPVSAYRVACLKLCALYETWQPAVTLHDPTMTDRGLL